MLELRKESSELRARVRWQEEQQLHLTLKFLGEVSVDKSEKVPLLLEEIASSCSSFSRFSAGLCGFPERGKLRVLALEMEDPDKRLGEIKESIEGACASLGFEREQRAFVPHITLGRVKEDSTKGQLRNLLETMAIAAFEINFSSLTLFSSTLNPQGAEYKILSEYKFPESA